MRSVPRSASHVRSDMYRVSAVSTAVLRISLIFGLLSFVSSGLGIWLASRQLWLQSLPEDQLPACGPDIYFILERFPIFDGLKTMFFGSGNCAEVQWTFLNLSIPGWTLLFYVFTALVSVWLIIFRGPRPFRLFKS